jgi:hypothetical protein
MFMNRPDLWERTPELSALRRAGWAIATALSLGFSAAAGAAVQAPPGHNVHLVQETRNTRFWRGGAPRRDTLEALAAAARSRGVTVTLVDLRKPATRDDLTAKGDRLSPAKEEALAKRLGLRYLSISALDQRLDGRLRNLVKQGDVYMHCMYGVNRTGFATARYARAAGIKVSTTALGKRDWQQGDRFQAGLERKGNVK